MGKLQFNAPVGALFFYMLHIKDTTLWGSVSSMDRGMQAVPVLVEGGTQVQEHDVSEKFFLRTLQHSQSRSQLPMIDRKM